MPVVSPHLDAGGAAWDEGPGAGAWIAGRLGPFGAAVGHATPLGYAAYAVVPIPCDDDGESGGGSLGTLEALLDVLAAFTGDQPVHCGMWDGWAWWYDAGTDPRSAPGMSVGVHWAHDDRPSRDAIERARADALEKLAADRVERPTAEPLELPHRRYCLWTGPLRSATAFRHWPNTPPSLIWPEDRSWFVGVPIYTNEIAIAGTVALIDALVSHAPLRARRATPDDLLDGDD